MRESVRARRYPVVRGAMSEETMDGDKSAVSAYLGKGIRRVGADSSLLVSSSRWLNNRDDPDGAHLWHISGPPP